MSNDVSWPYVEHNETVAVGSGGTESAGGDDATGGSGFELANTSLAVLAVAGIAGLAGGVYARRR